MEDIELVIKIPKDVYNYIKANGARIPYYKLTDAIKNGTPLPKGHGDLIDREMIEYLKAIHDAKYRYISWGEAVKRIKYSAPTIIEADKEQENGNDD